MQSDNFKPGLDRRPLISVCGDGGRSLIYPQDFLFLFDIATAIVQIGITYGIHLRPSIQQIFHENLNSKAKLPAIIETIGSCSGRP